MSITSSLQNRIVNKAQGEAAKVINKLAGKKGDNIQTLTFPHNLQNQAQSTYMVIYVLDNNKNNQTYSSTVFDSSVEKTSYEIKAITFLKDYAKQELNRLKNWAKDEAKALAKGIGDELKSWAITKTETVTGLNAKKTAEDLKEVGQWVNEWLVPHKVTTGGNALKKSLDPLNNIGAGWTIKQAFAIQMPSSSLRYNYENGWESTDTSTLATIKSLLSGVTGMFGNSEERSKAMQKLGSVAEKIEQSLGDLVSGGGFSKDEQAKKNIVMNPVLAFNYTVPKPREFSYSFQLYPRNKEELYTLFNMIQMLKFYSLPTQKDNLWYNYPAKFVIKFYTNGYENEWFPKTMTLGLTRIEETLTGENGDLAFFENYFDTQSGNPPRMINLTLNFKELGILERKYANAGY